MSWLKNIQNKPYKEKIRLIYMIAGVVLILLILFWVLVGNIEVKGRDTTLFKAIGKSIEDWKTRDLKQPLEQ